MGKNHEHQLPIQQRDADVAGGGTGPFLCQRCTARIFRQFNFKCFAVLLLSFAVFVSVVFWVFPRHYKQYGFDANQFVKQSASVQAYFKLPKPVSELIPHIARLEYEINEEIGVPYTKVALLSMHQAGASNWTDVVFGFLSDLGNASVDPVSFSMLKLSLIDLFFQQYNLTFTNPAFGHPYSFEILKFPGGITVIPKKSVSVWQVPQILFNFTLNNSIFEINENYDELKEQLKLGLHLWPHENVFVQVTNKNGSTRYPPVILEASVTSDYGSLPPQRLKQLAQIISRSPSGRNLGLDNSVFGRVKEVILSSYLNHSINAAPPFPSPAPSPIQNDYQGPSSSPSVDFPPSPSPSFPSLPPSAHCDYTAPSGGGLSPSNQPSPAPATARCGTQLPPSPSPSLHARIFPPQASNHPSLDGPTSRKSPDPSPTPIVSHDSSRGPDKENGAPPPILASISPSQLSAAVGSCRKDIWWFCLFGFWTFYLLCSMF